MFFAQRHPFFVHDFALVGFNVQEVHEGRFFVDGFLHVFGRFHHHYFTAGIGQGVVIHNVVGFLADHFGFHAGAFQVRQHLYFFLVHAGQNTRQPQGHAGESPRRNNGRFGVDHLGNFRTDFILNLVEQAKFLRAGIDGVQHFVVHQRARHVGKRTGRVDERADAKFLEQVAFWRGLRGCFRRKRKAADQPAQQGNGRQAFNEFSSA